MIAFAGRERRMRILKGSIISGAKYRQIIRLIERSIGGLGLSLVREKDLTNHPEEVTTL